MSDLQPNVVVQVEDVKVETEPVPGVKLIAGEPKTGMTVIGSFGSRDVGVWEMTTGTMWDVEIDELFVVLRGAGTVEFDDGSAPIEITAGSVVKLAAGVRTVWTVTETIRKVYLT